MTACTFRPACAADREAVFAFTAKTWDWGDYLPQVWDVWLADAQGALTVALADGRVVAVGKLSIVGSREGWLEGHRVDPNFRQQGISLAFTAYQVELARRLELRVLRLATGSSNSAVHRVAARLGFHRVAVFAPLVAEALGTEAPELTILSESHYSAVQNWLGRSSIYRACAGLCSEGWSWRELTAKHVRASLAAGAVVALFRPDGSVAAFGLRGSRAETGEPERGLHLGYVDGEASVLGDLALALRALAASASPPEVRLMLVDEPTLRGIFQAAAFRPDSDGHGLWVFEKVL